MQLAGKLDKAKVAYEKAAHANERGGGTQWHAAKHLESAATLAKELNRWDSLYDFIDRAASLYIEAGKISVGARSSAKTGACIPVALHLYIFKCILNELIGETTCFEASSYSRSRVWIRSS